MQLYQYGRTLLGLLCLCIIPFFRIYGQGAGNDSVKVKMPHNPSHQVFVRPFTDSMAPVIVRPKDLRPRFLGDTLVYNTNNIQLKPYASVEELLVYLPGLHIDGNGNITYNGEPIKEILVDGEDIFASQPTIVTRNFDASKIARVEVIERKSERSRFSGIDDGRRTRTLNLILKDEYRKGYFGKVEAGGGGGGIYNMNGLLAAFRGREQFTALGFTSNNGSTVFNSGNSSSPGISALNGNDNALGASAGAGIPAFNAGALHYANTWGEMDNHIVGNYQYGNLLTKPETVSDIRQVLPDSLYVQHQRANSINRQDQHHGYGNYEWSIDKFNALRLEFDYSHTFSKDDYNNQGISTFNDTLVNNSWRSIHSTAIQQNASGTITWRLNSQKKQGRIFSTAASLMNISSNSAGFLSSVNQFYQSNGNFQSQDTTDQRKLINNKSKNFGGYLAYTEPLWKGLILGLDYGVNYCRNKSQQGTYNRGDDNTYQQIVDSLSSHFDGQMINHVASVALRGSSRHFTYVVKSEFSSYEYKQKDLFTDSVLRYRYNNITPRILLNYNPDNRTRYELSYMSSSIAPNISQLVPIRNNNDPLHITEGNPDLRPVYIQRLGFRYSHLSPWMVNLGLSLGLTRNNISTRTLTDSLGRQISQVLNVAGGKDLTFNFSINKKLGGVNAGFIANFNYNRNVNYIGVLLSHNDNYNSIGRFSISRYVPNYYSLQWNSYISHLDSRSSVNNAASLHYWSVVHGGNLSLFFFRSFEINTSLNYSWQEKSSDFTRNTSLILWDAFVGRNILSDRLVLKLQAINLLNQYAGTSRTTTGNVTTQASTNILGRYWLLSLAWRFDHKFRVK